MNDDPLATVRNILIEGLRVPERKVTPDARILHDLGVDGDDAGEVFEALYERFGTDFTELNRQWRVFFNDEGLSRWFGRALQPLTAAGLAEIVRAGRWPVDPSDVR